MSDPQPDVRWSPNEPKPRNRARVGILVGLSALALLIVALLLFFFLPRGDAAPQETTSPSPSATGSPTASASQTPEPTGTAEETPPPVELEPGSVRAGLDDQLALALDDVDAIATVGQADALGIVEQLQSDAQRLSDRFASAGVDGHNDIVAYVDALGEVRADVEAGRDVGPSLQSTRDSIAALRALLRS